MLTKNGTILYIVQCAYCNQWRNNGSRLDLYLGGGGGGAGAMVGIVNSKFGDTERRRTSSISEGQMKFWANSEA